MNPWAFLASIVTGFLDDWKQKRQNQRDLETATTQNRIRLAESEQTHNQEWEMRALEGRDDVVRRISFTIWSSPFIWAVFDAPGVKLYFDTVLNSLPEWYVGGYLAMTGAIWGISELKNIGVIQKGK